jgi:hypothetical protein
MGVSLYSCTCLQFLALQLKVKTMSPLSANEEDHMVPTDKPPSGCKDKKVWTDDNDEEVQQDDLKKMGEVKEIAEFFNRVPKKEHQEFLATMCETIGKAPKGALYYKPAPYGFPLDSQDKDDNVNKEAAEPDYKAIYEAYTKKERDAANAKTSAELNSGSSTARKLQSGFQIACASRSTNEINKVKVVL